MYDVDNDSLTVDDFNLPVGRQPEFTPPSRGPLKKSYSDPSYKRPIQPSGYLPEYPLHPPIGPPSPYYPYFYSRSPTPLSEQSSSHYCNSHGFDVSTL